MKDFVIESIEKEYKHIKSVEVFCKPSLLPIELKEVLAPYINEKKTTVRVYGDKLLMNHIYNVCDKLNIRCQKYII